MRKIIPTLIVVAGVLMACGQSFTKKTLSVSSDLPSTSFYLSTLITTNFQNNTWSALELDVKVPNGKSATVYVLYGDSIAPNMTGAMSVDWGNGEHFNTVNSAREFRRSFSADTRIIVQPYVSSISGSGGYYGFSMSVRVEYGLPHGDLCLEGFSADEEKIMERQTAVLTATVKNAGSAQSRETAIRFDGYKLGNGGDAATSFVETKTIPCLAPGEKCQVKLLVVPPIGSIRYGCSFLREDGELETASFNLLVEALPRTTVTLDPMGGTLDSTTVRLPVGSRYGFGLPTPTRIGYTFMGWFLNAFGASNPVAAAQAGGKLDLNDLVPAYPVTFYAGWRLGVPADTPTASSGISFYTITDDGEPVLYTTRSCTVSGLYPSMPQAPEKTGYTFAGWYTDMDRTSRAEWMSPVVSASLYGFYTREGSGTSDFLEALQNAVTVLFHPCGGTLVDGYNSKVYSAGKTYGEFLSVMRTGRDFLGWYADEAYTQRVRTSDVVTKTVTELYAKWSAADEGDDPTVPDPTVPDPTVPDPTVPDPTVPDPTVPDPTVPDPTVPDPTVPDPPRPVSMAIVGPSAVDACSGSDYVCTLLLSDGTAKDVIPAWSVESGGCNVGIGGDGYLWAFNDEEYEIDVTIEAYYEDQDISLHSAKTVTIAAAEIYAEFETLEVDHSHAGGEGAVWFYCSGGWTAAAMEDWISVGESAGYGSGTISYVLEPNEGENPRAGQIVLRHGERIMTALEIVQEGTGEGRVFALDSESTAVSYEGSWGSSIAVRSTMPWEASVNVEWVKLTKANGTGDGFFKYEVAPFYGRGSRAGVVSVTGGDQTIDFKVTQTGIPNNVSVVRWFANVVPEEDEAFVATFANEEIKSFPRIPDDIVKTMRQRGLVFAGWWTAPVDGEEVSDGRSVEGDLNTYAHWTMRLTDVSFYYDEWWNEGFTTNMPYGSALTAPTPSREGYICAGWNPEVPETVPWEDAIYTAKWVKLHAVEFGWSDEESAWHPVGKRDVLDGTALGQLPIPPERYGYEFDGWFFYQKEYVGTFPTYDDETSEYGSEDVYTYVERPADADMTVTGDMTLYARWRRLWVITFDANGGFVDETVRLLRDHAPFGEPPIPVRDGYVFTGWAKRQKGGSWYDKDEGAWDDFTFYAQWAEAVSVTLIPNGGTVLSNTVVVAKNAPADGLEEPVRERYVFLGWFTAPVGGTKVKPTTKLTKDVTYYARWQYLGSADDTTIVYETEDAYFTDADGSFALDLSALVGSTSVPKLTVSGLPTGIKYDSKAMAISGRVTKPGAYAVKLSATNATVKKPVTKEFTLMVPNLTCAVLPNLEPAADAYGVVMCGVVHDVGLIDCSPAEGWTVKAAGLPTGLKLVQDKATGAYAITGVPTKAGTNTVTFTASKKGEASQVATITLVTAALPAWAQGTFCGCVRAYGGEPDYEDDYGSATMTVAANGKVSGKIALMGTNWTFAAASYARSDGGDYFEVAANAKAGKATMPLWLRVSRMSEGGPGEAFLNASVEGSLGASDVASLSLWRNVWKDKETAAAAKAEIAQWVGLYTLSMDDGGYLSLTVGKDGTVKATGKLADGTAVSASAPLMYNICWEGFFTFVWASPSAYKGGFFVLPVGFGIARGPLSEIGAGPVVACSRNPQATGEYGAGFVRHLTFAGAYYDKSKKLNDYYAAMRLQLDSAPVLQYGRKVTYFNENGKKKTATVADEAYAADTLSQSGLTATVNEKGAFVVAKATKPVQDKVTKGWYYEGANDGALTLSFTQATGIFKGSYTYWYDYMSAYDETKPEGKRETWTHTSKKVSFEGILVPGAEGMRGFYLWDATSAYEDPKTGKPKTYKYKESHAVSLAAP